MTRSQPSDPDRCPGVATTHQAVDGAVARVRLPGGAISAAGLERLAHAAAEYGDGHLELTGRGNIQLRGVDNPAAVAAAVVDAGLMPSTAHDRVRNIELSPLTGRIGGLGDLRPKSTSLDELLRHRDGLAGLSGKFLFGLDDGRGDIIVQRPDVAMMLHTTATTSPGCHIVVDGVVVGSVDVDDAPSRMIDIAEDFLSRSGGAWRVADLPTTDRESLIDAARRTLDPPLGETGSAPDPADAPTPLVGWFEQDDGRVLLGAVVELGRLPSRLAEFIAAIGAPVIITPHREILICDLTEGVAETVVRVLAPMGLIFDANSPWTRVSSCVGAPGCARAHAEVRTDLAERVQNQAAPTGPEHWVGCARGCGSPTHSHLRVEATPQGYRSTYRH